jgi:hypothetical protein
VDTATTVAAAPDVATGTVDAAALAATPRA